MSNLIPSTGGSFAGRRDDKALNRAISGYDRTKAVGMARMEMQAELEATKVHAIGYVGQQAMQAVTMVSQLEGQLGQACPLAVTRLQGIADITALSMAQVVADATRRIGR
jgi:hypothetical protein